MKKIKRNHINSNTIFNIVVMAFSFYIFIENENASIFQTVFPALGLLIIIRFMFWHTINDFSYNEEKILIENKVIYSAEIIFYKDIVEIDWKVFTGEGSILMIKTIDGRSLRYGFVGCDSIEMENMLLFIENKLKEM